MTMFSSRTPPSRDPLPWVCDVHGRSCRWPDAGGALDRRTFNPLPTRQHNPPNPILVAVRADAEYTYAGDMRAWLATCILPETPFGYLAECQEEIDHAQRVLTRLANLANDEES